MAYPFLRKIGVFINARIRRLHSPSPRFSYSSTSPPPSSQSNPDRRLYAVPFWSAAAGSTGRFSGGLLLCRSHPLAHTASFVSSPDKSPAMCWLLPSGEGALDRFTGISRINPCSRSCSVRPSELHRTTNSPLGRSGQVLAWPFAFGGHRDASRPYDHYIFPTIFGQ